MASRCGGSVTERPWRQPSSQTERFRSAGPFLILLLIVVGTGIATVWREVFDIRRVRRDEALRTTGARLAVSNLPGAAKGFLAQLDRLLDSVLMLWRTAMMLRAIACT